MTTFFLHEQIYRDLAPIADRLITICGAGALGANLAETLARMGFRRLRVIDRDRIETHNLSTQPWMQQDVGAPKARTLANLLYRATSARVEPHALELTDANAADLLAGSAVVVDAFDNLPARTAASRAAASLGIACLHTALGLHGDYGCGLWDDAYTPAPGGNPTPPACNYPLTRPLAMLTAAAAAETLTRYLLHGERRGFEITLGDLRMTPA